MPKRERGGSLTDLLGEAAGVTGEPQPEPSAPETAREASEATRPRAGRGGGGGSSGRPGGGHVRASDGSYVRADGARRVSLQLKMDPDDKRALKVQAAAAGLSPAEYVASLVREDGRG